jgi:hypothetical protein
VTVVNAQRAYELTVHQIKQREAVRAKGLMARALAESEDADDVAITEQQISCSDFLYALLQVVKVKHAQRQDSGTLPEAFESTIKEMQQLLPIRPSMALKRARAIYEVPTRGLSV